MAYEILVKAYLPREKTKVVEVPSTLEVSEEDKKLIDKNWQGILEKNPHVFDGHLWRYEGVYFGASENPIQLGLQVSPVSYKYHAVMRKIPGKSMDYYPNPTSINAVMGTSDSYLVIGVKGGISDNTGLGFVGGFLDKINNEPEQIFDAVERKLLEEVEFYNKESFDINKAILMGIVYGESHDTTCSVYVPLNCTSKELELKEEEHADTRFLSIEESKLEEFLNTKGRSMGGLAVDHCLGDVFLYLENLKSENIIGINQN